MSAQTLNYRVVAMISQPGPGGLLPPTNLVFAVLGTSIQLSWTNHATTATGNVVEYSMDGVIWFPSTPPVLPSYQTTYTQQNLVSATLYQFRVRAINNSGQSSNLTGSASTTGTIYYVAPPGSGGSDSNPGTLAQPFATFAHGASVLHTGDTLMARTGTYAENLANSIPGGSSADKLVVVTAYPGISPYEVATIQPTSTSSDAVVYLADASRSFIMIQGLVIDAVNATGKDAVKITYSSASGASSNIVIKDCEIKNATGQQGILISTNPPSQNADNNQILRNKIHDNGNSNLHHGMYITSSNNVIDGNESYNNAGYGIQIYFSVAHNSNYCQNNIVRNNRVHDNNTAGSGSGGIVIATGDNNLVYNNVVWNNTSGGVGGIQAFQNVNGTKIYNNTCWNNADYNIHIQTGCTNTVAQNNILYQGVTGAIINNGTGSTVDHNTTNAQDPKFANLAGNDFHLLSGSPAIDAGVALAQVTVDADGIQRPQGAAYDIGAYEFH